MADTKPLLSESGSEAILQTGSPVNRLKPIKLYLTIFFGLLAAGLLASLLIGNYWPGNAYLRGNQRGSLASSTPNKPKPNPLRPVSRGPAQGVSEKTSGVWYHAPGPGDTLPDPWNSTMLACQRTVLHFQPEKNWMNGSTTEAVQVQNLAYPANLSDPLLIKWVKYNGNPVLVPPRGIYKKDFRDPTTAWLTSEGKWCITIGSKINKTGISLVYDTEDFINYEMLDGVLHAVPGTGKWECVDFFPVSTTSEKGLDTSVNGPGVKHVVKVSLDDDRHDYYAIGTYHEKNGSWIPDEPKIDLGIGNRNKAIPRTILLLDNNTGTNLLQWPVEETDSLRLNSTEFKKVPVQAGSVVSLDVGPASQLDIIAEFEVDNEALKKANGVHLSFSCKSSGGAVERGALGPIGLLVLADESLGEQTPVYFYIAKSSDGKLNTFFCNDLSRSSKAPGVDKQILGNFVPILEGENLSLRILVDHSIIESFAQGGRTVVTSRVYPTEAINGAAKVFLFNNATETSVTASLKIWQMNSASIEPYPVDDKSSATSSRFFLCTINYLVSCLTFIYFIYVLRVKI
ncbi:hypothetical protein V6N13_097523 [Hibiscus sabdariffa]